jgi:hypothetical protein
VSVDPPDPVCPLVWCAPWSGGAKISARRGLAIFEHNFAPDLSRAVRVASPRMS